MNKDEIAGLVNEARLDAKAFRENRVYDSDGDTVWLGANADRLEQYADALTTLSARVETLEAALRASIDVMEPMAKYPKVNPWLMQAKAALGGGNG